VRPHIAFKKFRDTGINTIYHSTRRVQQVLKNPHPIVKNNLQIFVALHDGGLIDCSHW